MEATAAGSTHPTGILSCFRVFLMFVFFLLLFFRGVEIESREPCTGSLTDTSARARCDCRRVKKPVCGTNGRTYANQCLATCK